MLSGFSCLHGTCFYFAKPVVIPGKAKDPEDKFMNRYFAAYALLRHLFLLCKAGRNSEERR